MRLRFVTTFLILTTLATAAMASSSETRSTFKKGLEQFEAKKYYPAIETLKIAVKDLSYPLTDYGYYYIAESFQAKKDYQKAITVYKTVIDYFPTSILVPKSLLQTAQCQIKQKEYKQANQTLRVLIAKFPQDDSIAQARYLLGQNLEALDKNIEAARVYRNLDLLHRNSYFAEKGLERLDILAKKTSLAGYEAPAATIYNLGVKYFQLRNYRRAKGYFTRIYKFYRKSSFYDEAIFMLGRIELRRGRLSNAAFYFKKCINRNKDSKPQAILYLGITYAYQDNLQAAVKTLNKVITNFPKSHSADEALWYMGRYYRKLNKTEPALAAYLKLVTDYPSSAKFTEALFLTGNLYYQNGSFEAAYEHFSQVYKRPVKHSSARLIFWTAKTAEKLGRKNEAIQNYKTTIKLFDHSYYGYRAREELKKYDINLSANNIPETTAETAKIAGNNTKTKKHEEKYQELLAVGLPDEAAAEAAYLVDQLPLTKKDQARIAKYHAYIIKGKYARPLIFAEKKLEEAMLSGQLASADPRLWRFAYPRGYWSYVNKYAKEYNVDPYLVYAVIREESHFRSRALSRAWAHGLMQIMPGTARRIASALGMRYSRWKTYQPRVNIQMGSYYLASLIKRFDGNVPLALIGYNGGPVRTKKWLKANKKPFDLDEFVENIPINETRNYVKKVMKSYYGYKRTYGNKG